MKFTNYEEAIKALFYEEKTKRDYSLESTRIAYEKVWKPLEWIKVIHIAGTNGKGSVSRMIFSILKQAWKKVGMFTSPHLIDLRERFITNWGMIEKEEFLFLLNKILSLQISLSFFEKCTLIAFEYFRLKKVEYAIIEVGLWWLLDSTNIVHPEITAITSISYDHMDFLWNTLVDISYQKAGIIKEKIPIVYNHKNDVIEKIAREKNAPIFFTEREENTNLLWDYQKKNAWIAYEIAKYLWIEESIIKIWLMQVKNPWRLEYVQKNLLIDGAHNEAGCKELKRFLVLVKDNFSDIVYVIAQKKNKSGEIIRSVFSDADNFIFVEGKNNPLLQDPEILKKTFETKGKKGTIKKVQEVKNLALRNPQILYVVFWSLYMIGDFLESE